MVIALVMLSDEAPPVRTRLDGRPSPTKRWVRIRRCQPFLAALRHNDNVIGSRPVGCAPPICSPPARRAAERDLAAIDRWVAERWPAIKQMPNGAEPVWSSSTSPRSA